MGIEQDQREAVKWLGKAAEQGDAGAKEALDEINAASITTTAPSTAP